MKVVNEELDRNHTQHKTRKIQREVPLIRDTRKHQANAEYAHDAPYLQFLPVSDASLLSVS